MQSFDRQIGNKILHENYFANDQKAPSTTSLSRSTTCLQNSNKKADILISSNNNILNRSNHNLINTSNLVKGTITAPQNRTVQYQYQTAFGPPMDQPLDTGDDTANKIPVMSFSNSGPYKDNRRQVQAELDGNNYLLNNTNSTIYGGSGNIGISNFGINNGVGEKKYFYPQIHCIGSNDSNMGLTVNNKTGTGFVGTQNRVVGDSPLKATIKRVGGHEVHGNPLYRSITK